MLDTVGIKCKARLRDASFTWLGSRVITVGEHWKARVRDGWLVRAEGSLTRHNAGRLPRTEGELAAALKGALADIAKFAELGDWRFDRLDLAYDVTEPTAPLVRACRQFRFPGIRKAAEVADDDSSIRWGSRRSIIQVQLYDAAKRHRLSAIYQSRLFVESGGLMALSPNQEEQFRLAARYAGRIVRGAKPSNLPILHPSRYYLSVKLSAAAEIGLKLPQPLLRQADFLFR